ncbi:hypothetical protein ASPWEDRAFT_51500 [Aspergillus wentii DTO 134E9]|uniref:Uncharacterized protein n=1 Tax=Aspergillus wentii DTO 134E9 TaxID=1073089 RepID=A0A1L9RKM2_ASPWE|nr:uncharacterized protein ASPWEDRAFT_51500 [Aspergillus wentii DTO 134E9]KAI9924768.1 hypothetical protein MW887_006624 [Aspergillus wentii]OJJ35465.1 hypothetical protein ASPWEDRAFT_51500 [Aspergillus wentii DTO 134E9]
MASDINMNGSDPVPTLPQPNDAGRAHMSSLSSSSSISDAETEQRRGRSERPRMASRKPSASILVPRDHPEIEIEEEEFPPDDARAMSPRRNSADLERLGKEARQTLQEQAKALQSSLQALAERIEAVKSDHDKLESENKFLQDYIGGLTRNVTKSDLPRTSTKARKSQK